MQRGSIHHQDQGAILNRLGVGPVIEFAVQGNRTFMRLAARLEAGLALDRQFA